MADTRITFQEFCDVCEKIQTFSKFADKEKELLDFMNNYKIVDKKSNSESTLYPVLRLLVPELERERSPYGLKETSFSKLLVRALCLRGNDADQLLKYNKVSSTTKITTDFADVAYWVLRKRCPNTSSITIADVNDHLNKMAQMHADHQPREVEKELSRMIKSSTAVEQKWIIRVILKNMRLGLGNDRILKVFHPDAPDLYDVSSNLSKICTTLNDINIRLHELEVEIFTPFRPMLSLQCDSDVLNKVVKGDKIFFVEDKFDGERFQLHMKDSSFKYFSKNGYDYSNIYGETYNSGLITKHLSKIFSNYNSLILDGEMMGWNIKTQKFGSKGMSYDVKKLTNDSKHRPCYIVFDILLLNGRVLTNRPLAERLVILDNLFEPITGIIMRSLRIEVRTKQELMQELNKSVDRKDEGICFKDPHSVYKPNMRKAGWWKMKLEYFDGLMTELDVIILGGYYGDGRRKGLVRSFLLGVAVSNDTGESPKEFHTFAKVASGISAEEFDKLSKKLDPHWEDFDTNKTPEMIIWKKEKPDCWIDPRKSCILQIKASELTRSNDFQTDYTLRFPRVEKIRYDKPWYNCLTLNELKDLTKSNKAVEKLSGRHLTEGDIEVSPTKRRKIKDTGSDSLTHLFDVPTKSSFLDGKEFCVVSGNEQFSKETIEVQIKENGGRVVQYTGPKTFCTLVGITSPSINRSIKSATYDIVKLDWIIKVLSSRVVNLSPDDMIVTSENTKLLFSNRFDKYGDSYLQPATRKTLKKVLENIDKEGDYLNLLSCEYKYFDEEISFNNPLGLFRSCYIYFDKYSIVNDCSSETQPSSLFAELDFVFYGGSKCEKIESYSTHIIFHTSDCSRMELIKAKVKEINNENIKFINENWIADCISAKKLIYDEKYCM